MRQPIRFALILAAGVAFGASAAYADETIASRGDVKVTLDELREVLGRQEQQIKDQILGNPQAMRRGSAATLIPPPERRAWRPRPARS